MSDHNSDLDFYHQRCDRLERQLLELRQELDDARQQLRCSHTTTELMYSLHQLEGSGISSTEIDRRFLQILVDTLNVDRAMLLDCLPHAGSFSVRLSLGYPAAIELQGDWPVTDEPMVVINSDTSPTPITDFLRQLAQAPFSLWVWDSEAGQALMVANALDAQSGRDSLTEQDGQVLQAALRTLIHIRKGKEAEAMLRRQLAAEEMAANISSRFVNVPPHNVEAEIRAALGSIGYFLRADQAYFGLLESGGEALDCAYTWSTEGAQPLPECDSWPVFWDRQWTGPVSDLPGGAGPARDFWQDLGPGSLMNVPVYENDAPVGCIGFVSSDQEHAWPQASGSLLRLVGEVFINVLDRQRSSLALQESEANYRQLVHNVNGIVIRLDGQGNIIFVNDYAERFFGYDSHELLGRNIVGTIVPPLDSEGHDLQSMIKLIVAHPAEYAYNENENMCKGGDRVWVAWSNRAVPGGDGQPVEVFCVGTDITERRRASEELQRSLVSTLLLNRVIAAVSSTLDASSILETVCFELAQALDIPQTAFAQLDENEEYLQVVAEYRAPGRPSALEEKIPVAGNEATQYVLEHGRPLFIADAQSDPRQVPIHNLEKKRGTVGLLIVPLFVQGKVVGTLGLDSTEPRVFTPGEVDLVQNVAAVAAKALENSQLHAAVQRERENLTLRVAERTAELQAANKALARAARSKDEFLANMSHELRTPLNAILGLSEALQENVYGSLTERQQKSLASIESSGRHLLALINDILDISKIEAGRLTLDLRPVSVSSLSQTSLDMIRPEADRKQIAVSFVVSGPQPHFWADERRLKQLLVNLLANAIKFTPEGGKIGLQVISDSEARRTRFTVWDTGIGIAEADLERMWQPFVQLDGHFSRRYQGTGLGLALARRLAMLHGGSIEVESQLNEGSRFTVTIPWADPHYLQVR